MFGRNISNPATTAKILIITVLVLVTFCLSAAEGSISKSINYSASFTNNVFPVPGGISIGISITPEISGTITVTGPGGYTWTQSISGPGSDSYSRTLGAAGTYTVNEDYTLEVTGSVAGGLLPPITETYTASDTWTFDAATDGATGNLGVSSSFGSLAVSDHSDNIKKVVISGLSATITVGDSGIPIGDSVSLTASGQWNVTTSMTVSEAPIEIGTVKVNTNHANATFDITGPGNRSGSGTSATWPGMEVGVYTATFGAIPDYFTPEPQVKTLTADGTITFTGDYVSAIQTGTVEVFTNRASANFNVAGPTPRSGSGTFKSWSDMQIGEYTATFDPMGGYTTPAQQIKTLTADGKITFNGVYTSIVETGTVEVTTNNTAATFEVSGPDNGSGSGIFKSWSDMEVGTYTAIFHDVAGFITPAPKVRSLTNGGTISFNGEYTPIASGTGTMKVQTNLKDGVTFIITSPDYTEADFTFEDFDTYGMWTLIGALVGDHTIAYGEVADYVAPESEILTLVEGGTITFVGEYIPILPMINTVDISGSPAGLGDTIIVTMSGDPGREASFSIDGIVSDVTMTESESTPGLYIGEHVAQEGDNVQEAIVSVTLVGVEGTTATNEDRRVTIDTTPPVIDSVAVFGSPARRVGDVITVTMMGEPGGIASFSILGVVDNVSMTERAEEPGTYDGTYSAGAGLNVSGAKVAATLSDAVGNTSTDESQTASICTLPWDINDDGIVDVLDIGAVSSHLGETDIPELDLNGDGFIDMLDVLEVAIHYGEQCDPDGDALASAPFAPYTIPNYLYQNYPNPCNPGTWIPFILAQGEEVAVSIYNPAGQLIRRLDLGYKGPGVYVSRESGAYWDGSNESGEQVASGVYFYHIQAGRFSAVRKMLVSR